MPPRYVTKLASCPVAPGSTVRAWESLVLLLGLTNPGFLPVFMSRLPGGGGGLSRGFAESPPPRLPAARSCRARCVRKVDSRRAGPRVWLCVGHSLHRRSYIPPLYKAQYTWASGCAPSSKPSGCAHFSATLLASAMHRENASGWRTLSHHVQKRNPCVAESGRHMRQTRWAQPLPVCPCHCAGPYALSGFACLH